MNSSQSVLYCVLVTDGTESYCKSSQLGGQEIPRLLTKRLLLFSQERLEYTPHYHTLISLKQIFNNIFPSYAYVDCVVSSLLFWG
jgi:hypothetical protein